MLGPRYRNLFLLMATILMAGSLPVQSTCEMNAHPDVAACSTASGHEVFVPTTDSPDEDSHCGTGCTDCGLPCCVGSSMILAAPLSLAAVTPIQAPLVPESLVRPQVDPVPLGHPPRA